MCVYRKASKGPAGCRGAGQAHVCICVCVCVSVCVYIGGPVKGLQGAGLQGRHMYVYIHVCVCMCVCRYMCVCVYVFMGACALPGTALI